MEPPPKIIDGALLQAFATLDSTVVFTNRTQVFVDGKQIGRVPALAICQQLRDSEILLFYCDDQWDVIGVSGFKTIQLALDRAEIEYRGVTKLWQFSGFNESSLTPEDLEPKCSLCGEPYFKIDGLFEGTNAYICYQCISNLHDEVLKEKH